MNTIVIPVGKSRPEDDLLNLIEILTANFPNGVIRSSDALVIETDIPQAAALFKAIAGVEIPVNGSAKIKEKKFLCIEPDCDNPVSKPNIRCKKHAMQRVGEINRINRESKPEATDAEQGL